MQALWYWHCGNILQNGLLSALPFVVSFTSMILSGLVCDYAIQRGLSRTIARRVSSALGKSSAFWRHWRSTVVTRIDCMLNLFSPLLCQLVSVLSFPSRSSRNSQKSAVMTSRCFNSCLRKHDVITNLATGPGVKRLLAVHARSRNSGYHWCPGFSMAVHGCPRLAGLFEKQKYP